MPMTANGLAKLIEELSELSQVAAKKLAYFHTDEHPDGAGSLKKRMEEEMADVYASMEFVMLQFGLDPDAIRRRADKKFALFNEWHDDATNGGDGFQAEAKR